jgi:hypothetical protein
MRLRREPENALGVTHAVSRTAYRRSSAKTLSRTRDDKTISISTTKTLSLTGRTRSLASNGTTRYLHGARLHEPRGAFLRENGTTVRGLVAGLRQQH